MDWFIPVFRTKRQKKFQLLKIWFSFWRINSHWNNETKRRQFRFLKRVFLAWRIEGTQSTENRRKDVLHAACVLWYCHHLQYKFRGVYAAFYDKCRPTLSASWINATRSSRMRGYISDIRLWYSEVWKCSAEASFTQRFLQRE